MSSANTTAGFQNLPVQAITTGTETALLVPASGTFGSGLPSPVLAAGAGLFVGFPPDIAGSIYDGHPFVVSVFGKVTTGASSTFLPKLYQVPGAIALAGTSATVANDNIQITSAAPATVATTTSSFSIQAQFLWDSTSKVLTGQVLSYQVAGVNVAPNSGTAGTYVATTTKTGVALGDLNFIVSFLFGTANAANAVQITEFVIDRA